MISFGHVGANELGGTERASVDLGSIAGAAGAVFEAGFLHVSSRRHRANAQALQRVGMLHAAALELEAPLWAKAVLSERPAHRPSNLPDAIVAIGDGLMDLEGVPEEVRRQWHTTVYQTTEGPLRVVTSPDTKPF